ncbi:MAG: dihydrofolate reductase [Acidobacteria bacterium]|nr:dihydrofolate reductase [Acidobacteriota bacterium]
MIRLYVAASLDGYIADADGGVAWLDRFNTPEVAESYERFTEQIGTMIIGRKSFEQALTFGDWLYGAMRTYVLTSQPLVDPPDNVEPISAAQLPALIENLRDAELDTWLMGGGQTVKTFFDLKAVDEIELYVIPLVLGDGIPLFPTGCAANSMRLEETAELPRGMAMLRYRLTDSPDV